MSSRAQQEFRFGDSQNQVRPEVTRIAWAVAGSLPHRVATMGRLSGDPTGSEEPDVAWTSSRVCKILQPVSSARKFEKTWAFTWSRRRVKE